MIPNIGLSFLFENNIILSHRNCLTFKSGCYIIFVSINLMNIVSFVGSSLMPELSFTSLFTNRPSLIDIKVFFFFCKILFE